MPAQLPVAAEFLETLRCLPRRQRTLLVGIDGRGGSGKSTFARHLEQADNGVTVVEFDDFYRPLEEREALAAQRQREVGASFDWRRVREQVLAPLCMDEEARYQRYDWPTDTLAEWHSVPVGGVVLVEGNYSTRSELFAYYDYTVWIEAPHDLRLERGLQRGGANTLDRWLTEWMPEEERYLAAEDPISRVHLVLDGSA